ncbi:MAG: DUF4303 domain-containing protein, partial [bacterium]|nr:DUF4303 domain-containing protein [bacterium]
GIDIRDLRWSEADSPFDLFGDDYFKPVEESFSLFGAPYQLSEETREMLLSCIIQALANLDSKGFFGTGAERNKVVLNVTMPGDETEKDLLARARLLNPKDALITYESDWSN